MSVQGTFDLSAATAFFNFAILHLMIIPGVLLHVEPITIYFPHISSV
jgi:hypothetical protein